MAKRLTIHRDNKAIYDIIIEKDFTKLASELNSLDFSDKKLCIVSDSIVADLYLEQLKNELNKVSNTVIDFVFEAGEENKNLNVVKSLYEHLIINHFERRDVLVALGGGVVGDLTGFAAATYLRGIDFIQIPTTLLAQVDSSIGGKTGVDFDSYKNMVGAFHMPRLVYINTSTLNSLNDRIFNSGFGEILKHAYIKNRSYLDYIIENHDKILQRDSLCMEEIVFSSCKIKGQVVENDPTEKGERMLLNYGHTLGHAIEKLSNFSMYHGECVVLGMICAMYISMKRNYISPEEYNNTLKIFKSFNYPLKITGMTSEEIIKISKSDKKMSAGKIRFTLLKEVGNAYIDYAVTDEEMCESTKEVLK